MACAPNSTRTRRPAGIDTCPPRVGKIATTMELAPTSTPRSAAAPVKSTGAGAGPGRGWAAPAAGHRAPAMARAVRRLASDMVGPPL